MDQAEMSSNSQPLRRKRTSAILICLTAAVAGSILYASAINQRSSSSPSLRSNGQEQHHRQLAATAIEGADQDHNRQLIGLNLAQFVDPKSVTLRSDAPQQVGTDLTPPAPDTTAPREQFIPVDHKSRHNCQVIYITGVEGATHHGFIPIIESLAKNQVDPETGKPYKVETEPKFLKAGLFGWYSKKSWRKWGFLKTPEVDDPAFVQHVVRESCPDDGHKHVLIEWASFPSGQEDDHRSYRVKRQHEWLTMTPDEIANSDEALKHPTNMNAFYQAYSPYVDIKFIVLHRPFLETIASHKDWDGGPIIHSNIIRGFMLMLRRFLDTHLFDLVTGKRLWSLVCVERIMAKNYETEHDTKAARKRVMSYLTTFLGWDNGDCPQCFDSWHESSKVPEEVLGEENVSVLRDHMSWLEGVWPPPGEDGIAEQQCPI
jgi:hypothetical protein